MPIFFKVLRMVGQVPSPTPMIPICSLSIRVTCNPDPSGFDRRAARNPAVSHPAAPPSTIKTDLVILVIESRPSALLHHEILSPVLKRPDPAICHTGHPVICRNQQPRA